MSYVIRFTDGTFNNSGWGVPIEKAVVYDTVEQAERIAEGLINVDSVQPVTQPKFIPVDALIEVIQNSTKTQKVLTYYTDFQSDCIRSMEQQINYVEPNGLIRLLREWAK